MADETQKSMRRRLSDAFDALRGQTPGAGAAGSAPPAGAAPLDYPEVPKPDTDPMSQSKRPPSPMGSTANPNVGANGSAEARAFQQSGAGRAGTLPPKPMVPEPQGPITRTAKSVGRFAAGGAGRAISGAARVAAPAAAIAGLTSGFNNYKIDDPEVDSSASGTLNYLKSGEYGKFGQSLSKGALETGMDLASGAAKTIDSVAGMVGVKPDLSGKLDRGLRSQFGTQLKGPESSAAASGTTSAPAPSVGGASGGGGPYDARDLGGDMIGGPAVGATPTKSLADPLNNTGVAGIRREGNTFTNLAPGQDLKFEPRTAAEGQANMERNISSMERTAAIKRETGLRDLGMRDRGDPDYYITGPGSKGGAEAIGLRDPGRDNARSAFDQQISVLQNKVANNTASDDERVALSSMLTNQMQTESQAGIRAADRTATSADRAADRAAGSEDRRFLAGQATADRAATRELTKYGYDLTNTRETQKMIADAMKSDRQYQLDLAKYGQERADKLVDQRSKGQADALSFINSVVQTGDKEADAAKAGEYTQRLTGMFGARIKELELGLQKPEVANNPNLRRQAETELKALQENPWAALGQDGLRQYVARQKAQDLARKGEGLLSPGTNVETDTGPSSLKKEEGWIWDSYVSPQGHKIPAFRLGEGALGLFTPRNRGLESIIQR